MHVCVLRYVHVYGNALVSVLIYKHEHIKSARVVS